MPDSYEVTQQRQAAELALVGLRPEHRNEVVRLAHAYGVPKRQISRLSGLARTTIDRILSAAPGQELPEDVPACTRMDKDLPQAVRAPSLADALRASLDLTG